MYYNIDRWLYVVDMVWYNLIIHNVEDLHKKTMIVFIEEFKVLDDKVV